MSAKLIPEVLINKITLMAYQLNPHPLAKIVKGIQYLRYLERLEWKHYKRIYPTTMSEREFYITKDNNFLIDDELLMDTRLTFARDGDNYDYFKFFPHPSELDGSVLYSIIKSTRKNLKYPQKSLSYMVCQLTDTYFDEKGIRRNL